MKFEGGRLKFTPSDLSTFFKSPYAAWITRFNVENPDKKIDKEENLTLDLFARKGDAHERALFDNYQKDAQLKVIEIPRTFKIEIDAAATIEAMRSGADLIYQGALAHGDFYGWTDFMMKVPEKSKLGEFSYEVLDAKLSHRVKPEFAIQIGCYSEMLAEAQGRWPRRWHVLLGDGRTESFSVSDFRFYYEHIKARFLEFQHDFASDQPPFPDSWEQVTGYEERVKALFKAADHPSLIAGISQHQIRSFQSVGLTTKTAIATASDKPKKMRQDIFNRLKEQAELQGLTEARGEVHYRVLEHRSGRHVGLARLPSANEGDVIFDMEGYPFLDEGFEYLFGVLVREGGKWVYREWRAEDAALEKGAFAEFTAWLMARLRKFPRLHVYHYANYEKAAMAKLSNKHSLNVAEVDLLLRNEVFVDLYQVVKEGLRVGTESYSIKKLEALYDFKRRAAVSNAGDSVVQFNDYLGLKATDPSAAAKIFADIVDYNREDVESTLALLEWLRRTQKEQGIDFVDNVERLAELEGAKDWENASEKLTGEMPKWLTDAEDRRVNLVIAGLVGYFQRENRPGWWRYFERADETPEALFDDADCLANAEVTEALGAGRWRVKFDPLQDLKVKAGSKLEAVGVGIADQRVTVLRLDYALGTAEIEAPRLRVGDVVTLVPTGPITTQKQEAVLMQMARRWWAARGGGLTTAAADLLYRRPPRLKDRPGGVELYAESTSPLEAALDLALQLDASMLAIQGPPGTGKTYTGATIICHLLAAGKRVAVVAQGKKTIENLLGKVVERWGEIFPGKSLPSILMADSEKGGAGKNPAFEYLSNTDAAKRCGPYRLVGGTHYMLSRDELQNGFFDYLFIDEAGQFSLAAAIVCSFAAKNLILLGDQMQLEQVNAGAHPGDSGLSVLNYYLNGRATIPRTHGVFLDQTYRMHPSIGTFVSDLVYEGRLRSHESTKAFSLTHDVEGLPNAGLHFLAVEHDGNSTSSEEEAAAIGDFIKQLERTSLPGLKGDKVLVIAPYNAQVERVRAAVPGVKVGTVDLFQGQEAWVSVLSMCASGDVSAARGLEFLLSKNRINVGISRGKALSVVVGSPRLLDVRPTRIESIPLLNLYAALMRFRA